MKKHRISKDRVVALVATRKTMLHSIADSIGDTLHEALAKKIEYEAHTLESLVLAEEQSVEAHAERAKRLPTEYFSLKRLDVHTF